MLVPHRVRYETAPAYSQGFPVSDFLPRKSGKLAADGGYDSSAVCSRLFRSFFHAVSEIHEALFGQQHWVMVSTKVKLIGIWIFKRPMAKFNEINQLMESSASEVSYKSVFVYTPSIHVFFAFSKSSIYV